MLDFEGEDNSDYYDEVDIDGNHSPVKTVEISQVEVESP